ncbi:hypothetical protein BASA50_010196 [Batrachochytrium salamandrivorans]|uniref:Uncharacterized protein n=1 Tax=Batrachochytrium salamandrivorans TaxID=1357716 RepID=A0ABQ8EZ71_9FUNG|nr:hypothetical protein BASA62_009885 [Batrachochytrium salamandrivorans]KAH6589218.1 hypothetical protein BASA50_010196 [Batrachochytrium salamandrivorans]
MQTDKIQCCTQIGITAALILSLLLNITSAISTPQLGKDNRTIDANETMRLGIPTADPNFATTGTGPVTIKTLPTQPLPSSALLQTQLTWSTHNNISLEYATFPAAVSTNDDAAATIMEKCSQMSQSDHMDILWIDLTMVGALADCFLDLWAWDTAFGEKLQPGLLDAGVVNNRLDIQTTFLLYNKNYLSVHGYTDPPKTVDEMSLMLQDILENERAADNYKLSGYTSSFIEQQDWSMLVSEWVSASNATIINKDGMISIADSDFAMMLVVISTWLNNGIIDIHDMDTFNSANALDRFMQSQCVFLHTTASQLDAVMGKDGGFGVAFDWGIIPMPPLATTVDSMHGKSGVGVVTGYAAGVYKFSRNPVGAVKVLKYLVSEEYERLALLDGGFSHGSFPINNHLLSDSKIATHLTDAVAYAYNTTQIVNRPITQTGGMYMNVTRLLSTAMMDIFHGVLDIRSGLDILDVQLRQALGKHARNTTTDVDGTQPPLITRPGRKQIQYMTTQVLCLFAVILATVAAVLIFRYFNVIEASLKSGLDGRLWLIPKGGGGSGNGVNSSPTNSACDGGNVFASPKSIHKDFEFPIVKTEAKSPEISLVGGRPKTHTTYQRVMTGVEHEPAAGGYSHNDSVGSLNSVELDGELEHVRLIS